MITLRSYQSHDILRIRQAFGSGAKAPLYVAPTGSGKTTVFAAIARSSERRGKRVLILCHRIELIDQVVERLAEFDVEPTIIAAGSPKRKKDSSIHVAVASVQTLVRRLHDYPEPTLIVCDEAHHSANGNSWAKIYGAYQGAKLLGVTATPLRLDGRGLGEHFDRLIIGPSVRDLISQGYLVAPRIFAPSLIDTSKLHTQHGDYRTDESSALMDKPAITGDVLAHYQEIGRGLPALAFCTSIEHAHNVARQFRAAGIAALALDGGTAKDIRRQAVADFRAGRIQVLTNCDLFGEGVDLVGCHVGIMLRPTLSLSLYLQQIGRVLRPAPGKESAIILDHVNNVMRHGFPEDNRRWVLNKDSERPKKDAPLMARICKECFAASPLRASVCVNCGLEFIVKPRQTLPNRNGTLREISQEEFESNPHRQIDISTLEGLVMFGKRKGYKSPERWAMHVMQGRMAKKLKLQKANSEIEAIE